MSLVFDALKQHREPTLHLAAPLGSVLPVTERLDHSRSFSGKNLFWMGTALLLGASGSIYQFVSSKYPAPESQAGSLRPLPATVAVTAPATVIPAGEASPQVQAMAISSPDALKPAESASVSKDNAVAGIAPHPVSAAAKKPPVEVPHPSSANVAVKEVSGDRGISANALVRTANDGLPRQSLNASAGQGGVAQSAVRSSSPAAKTAEATTDTSRKSKPAANASAMAPKEIALLVAHFNDAVRNSEFHAAKELLNKVTAEFGADSLLTLRMHGFLAFKMGELYQAWEDYQQVVASLPNDHEANRNLAAIDLQQGNVEQTRKRSMRMLEVYPDDPVFKALAN